MQPDVLWDLEVNANRPDAMSVAGVARDLAAALGVEFRFPEYEITTTDEPVDSLLDIRIEDPELCGRFVATVLRDVRVGESPAWMQQRLIQLGMRPINSIVDISNYVMLELGQPNHTFDLATIPDGRLNIRRAREAKPGDPSTTSNACSRPTTGSSPTRATRSSRLRGHGWRHDRDLRFHDRGVAGDGVVGSAVDLPHREAPQPAERGLHSVPSRRRLGRQHRSGDAPFHPAGRRVGHHRRQRLRRRSRHDPDRTPVPVRVAKVNGCSAPSSPPTTWPLT